MENWKPVVGYEDFYEVSDKGQVRSLDRITNNGTQLRKGKILKCKLANNGYVKVHLSLYGKTKWTSVHRIVAMTFIPNPNDLPEVNHKNEIKTDNRVENLEWCDFYYNNSYGTINKRRSDAHTNNAWKSKPVLQFTLDGKFLKSYPSLSEAFRETGIDSSQIGKCCKNKKMYNSAGGFKWEFL